MLRALIVSFVAVTVLSASRCGSSPPLNVTMFHADDRVSWLSLSPPSLRVDSKNGIGAMAVELDSNAWPERFEIQLRLAALEGFVVRSGDEIHRLEVTNGGRVLLEPEHSQVLHMNSFQAIEGGQLFVLSIRLGNLAEPATTARLEWVDFYR